YTTGDPTHDYKSVHTLPDYSGNSEVIYWRKYVSGVSFHNQYTTTTRLAGGATKSIVEDFLCSDGLPISISPLYKGDGVYEDIFENRDPRLRQTILHPADQEYYFYNLSNAYTYPRLPGMIGGTPQPTGYHIIKYYNSE